MSGRPSCWYDCNGCGCCEEFKEYNGEPEEEEEVYEDTVSVERMLEEGRY